MDEGKQAGAEAPREEAEDHRVNKPNEEPEGDEVLEAGKESFPASDAPAWTGTVAARDVPNDESKQEERIQEASEESFPASDAPAWTGTVAARDVPKDDAEAEAESP